MSGTDFFEELSVPNILSSVFAHDSSELSQSLGSLLLIFYWNSGIVTEVNSTDGQQMLNIVLLDQTGEVVFNCLVSAHSHGSTMNFAHGIW